MVIPVGGMGGWPVAVATWCDGGTEGRGNEPTTTTTRRRRNPRWRWMLPPSPNGCKNALAHLPRLHSSLVAHPKEVNNSAIVGEIRLRCLGRRWVNGSYAGWSNRFLQRKLKCSISCFKDAVLRCVDFWVRKCVKTAAILFRPPRAFPLSVWVNLRRKFWIFTHKFTNLSTVSG